MDGGIAWYWELVAWSWGPAGIHSCKWMGGSYDLTAHPAIIVFWVSGSQKTIVAG